MNIRKLITRSGLWMMLSNGAGRGTSGGCLVTVLVLLIVVAGVVGAFAAGTERSVDYQVGWADGRAAALSEYGSQAAFRRCLEQREKNEDQCWSEQVDIARDFYRQWDALTDGEKIAYGEKQFSHRWIEHLHSPAAYDVKTWIAKQERQQ